MLESLISQTHAFRYKTSFHFSHAKEFYSETRLRNPVMYNLVVASEMISVFLRIDLTSLLIFVNKKKVKAVISQIRSC